jgi:hypothetical protein
MGDLATSLALRGHSPGCRGRRTCGVPARTPSRPLELTCCVLAPRRGTWSPASRAALGRRESRCVLLRHGLLQPRYRPARFFFFVCGRVDPGPGEDKDEQDCRDMTESREA